MLARVQSYLLQGIDALPCEVEIDLDNTAMSRRTIVGLPDAAVMESLERVDSAIGNSGYPIARGHFVINLAPADKKKGNSSAIFNAWTLTQPDLRLG
jgi:magnesium chelatase family protein